MQAHGTRYELSHEPFVVFDLMVGDKRMPYDEFAERIAVGEFVTPTMLHRGGPLSLDETLKCLGERGFHGSLDPVEGAVWRVERDKPTGNRLSGDNNPASWYQSVSSAHALITEHKQDWLPQFEHT